MTTWGCEIMITWEPSTSVIVAPARLAMARMTSLPAALSPVATTAQEGKALPGRHPARLGERPLGNGTLGGGHQGGLLGGQIGGEGFMEARRIDRELHGGLGSLARRIFERDLGGAQDAVL